MLIMLIYIGKNGYKSSCFTVIYCNFPITRKIIIIMKGNDIYFEINQTDDIYNYINISRKRKPVVMLKAQ